MLNEQLMHLLEAGDEVLSMEGSPQSLLIYMKNKSLSAEEMLDLIRKGSQCFDWFVAQLK